MKVGFCELNKVILNICQKKVILKQILSYILE